MRLNLKRKGQISLVILIVLAIAFIFAQSAMSGELSGKEAEWVAKAIDKIAVIFVDKSDDADTAPGGTEGAGSDAPGADLGENNDGKPSVGGMDSDSSDTPVNSNNGNNSDSSGGGNAAVEGSAGSSTTEPKPEPEPENEPEPIISRKILRKVAHFLEHGILGLLVFLFMSSMCKETYRYINRRRTSSTPFDPRYIFATLAFGMLVALLDETIQIFSKRGTSVSDVWIDMLGYTVFTAIAYSIAIIRNSRRKNYR